jgi:hypothetical protein
LTPATIIYWLIIQGLHGSTPAEHVLLLAGCAFTAVVWCLARSKLPLHNRHAVFRALVTGLISGALTRQL